MHVPIITKGDYDYLWEAGNIKVFPDPWDNFTCCKQHKILAIFYPSQIKINSFHHLIIIFI